MKLVKTQGKSHVHLARIRRETEFTYVFIVRVCSHKILMQFEIVIEGIK